MAGMTFWKKDGEGLRYRPMKFGRLMVFENLRVDRVRQDCHRSSISAAVNYGIINTKDDRYCTGIS